MKKIILFLAILASCIVPFPADSKSPEELKQIQVKREELFKLELERNKAKLETLYPNDDQRTIDIKFLIVLYGKTQFEKGWKGHYMQEMDTKLRALAGQPESDDWLWDMNMGTDFEEMDKILRYISIKE